MQDRINETLRRIENIVVASDIVDIGYIPLRNELVLQKIIHGERKSAAGILLAEMTTSNTPLARIVAVGPECSQFIKKGLLVQYNPMLFREGVINGVTYVFATEHGVLGIIEDEVKANFYPENPTVRQMERDANEEVTKRARKMSNDAINDLENRDSDTISKRKKNYKATVSKK